MSSALGIAGVTAVLESMLNTVFTGAGLGSVAISAVAPDIVQAGLGNGANQVNLFLHQVTQNAAWRNVDLPSLSSNGSSQLTNRPLALDLHYLLTAYTPEDGFAEALLGFALLMLHQNPSLSRNEIGVALTNLAPSHPLFTPLQSAGLADQVELLKITPDTLGREEMAWIWTALKADYRPTYAFQVSVVLLQPPASISSPLPVFKRKISVTPGPPPLLSQVQLPLNQAAAALGDPVKLIGESLTGVTKVAMTNQRLGFRYQPDITPTSVAGTAVSFTVPNDPTNLPAGVYTVSALFTNTAGTTVQSTNSLVLAVAPTVVMSGTPPAITNSAAGTAVTLHCTPQAQPHQLVFVAIGGISVPAAAFTSATSTLNFLFPAPGLATGSYMIRLQVDGVDSVVTWSETPAPPHFTGPFVTVPV